MQRLFNYNRNWRARKFVKWNTGFNSISIWEIEAEKKYKQLEQRMK